MDLNIAISTSKILIVILILKNVLLKPGSSDSSFTMKSTLFSEWET